MFLETSALRRQELGNFFIGIYIITINNNIKRLTRTA
jgi:hypothetical protein